MIAVSQSSAFFSPRARQVAKLAAASGLTLWRGSSGNWWIGGLRPEIKFGSLDKAADGLSDDWGGRRCSTLGDQTSARWERRST